MRKLVNMRLDEGLLRRVDEAAGRRGRTRFVERALEAALSGDPIGGTPSADKSPGGSASARPAASPRAPVERRGNTAQALAVAFDFSWK